MRTLRARKLLIPALLTIYACEHVPPAPIDPAASARELQQRTLEDPPVIVALTENGLAVPDSARWTLDQLTIAAWNLRSDIVAARAELDATRTATQLESSRPSAGVATTFERVTNAANGVKPWVLGASYGFTIEMGGKRDIRLERALARDPEDRPRDGAEFAHQDVCITVLRS